MRDWNNGMMENCNGGIMEYCKDGILEYRNDGILIPKPITPRFHDSIIPVVV
jgi:hypothetical protein